MHLLSDESKNFIFQEDPLKSWKITTICGAIFPYKNRKTWLALMKHGYREGSAFPKPLGNSSQINAHGQQVLESIVNHPERVIYERPHPDFGKVIEIVVPDKWGARFTLEGEMIGFLEP